MPTTPTRTTFYRRVSLTILTLALGALIATGTSWNITPAAQADQVSTIATGGPDPANVRGCPALPNAGVSTGECLPYAQLDNGTQVAMTCYKDGTPPDTGLSPRWFWVKVLDGPNAGVEGYVWSDLVDDQTSTPQCTDADTIYPKTFTPAGATVQQGAPAPAGYRYDITLTGFSPNSDVAIDCYASWSTEPFYSFTLTTDSNGDAHTGSYCYAADGPEHWVTANGIASNAATW